METNLRVRDMILNVDFEKLLSSLNEKKLVILYGTPGIGKTSNAIECAYKLKDEYKWIVHWFDTNSKEKLANGLRKLYESYNVLYSSSSFDEVSKLTFERLIDFFKNKFNSSQAKNTKFLLTFDNLVEDNKKEDWINYAISELTMPQNVHILITCRNPNVLENFNFELDRLEVKYLSKEQAKKYLSKNLKRKNFSNEETFCLEKYFSHNEILPYDLNLLVTVLNENELWDVKDFICGDQDLAEQIFKRLYEASILKKSLNAWLALEYMSLIDPDQIPISLLMKLLDFDGNDKKRFQFEVLNVLKRNSLILDINTEKYNEVCLKIHRRTQDLIRKILNKEKREKLEEKLIDTLKQEFPQVDKTPGLKWTMAKLLLNHVLFVYDKQYLIKNKESFVQLNVKIAFFFITCMGDYNKSLIYLTKVKEIREETSERTSELAWIYNELSVTFYNLGFYTTAKEYQLKALSIREEIFKDKNHPDLAWTYNTLGSTLSKMGFYDMAKEYQIKALKIYEEIYEENKFNPDLAWTCKTLGSTYSRIGEYEKAKDFLIKALNIYEEIHKNNKLHPDLGLIYNYMGKIYSQLKSYELALQYHKKSISLNESLYPEKNHINLAYSYGRVAQTYFRKGDLTKALSFLLDCIKIIESVYPENKHVPIMGEFYYRASQIYLNMNNIDSSLNFQLKSLSIREFLFLNTNKNHPDLKKSYMLMSRIYRQIGNQSLALEYEQKIQT